MELALSVEGSYAPGERIFFGQGTWNVVCQTDLPCMPDHDFDVSFAPQGGDSHMQMHCLTMDSPDQATLGNGVLSLSPPRPNPSSGRISFDMDLPRSGRVGVRVFDAAGRLVSTISETEMLGGRTSVVWDPVDASGRPLPGGMYWLRLDALGEKRTRVIVILGTD